MPNDSIRRVLVVAFASVPASDRQGVEIENLLKALAPRFQVDVLTVRTGEMGYVERYHHTRMLRVPVGSGDRRAQVDAFRRAVRRQVEGAEYDLIHFRSAYGGLPICGLKQYLDCRLVFELALTTSREHGRIDRVQLQSLAAEEQYCLAHADLVLVQSRAAQLYLESRGLSAPIVPVRPGVDIDGFDWEPSPTKQKKQVVYVGAIGPGRGLRLLLQSFTQVVAQTDARLVLVGHVEPIFTDYLENALAQLQLTDHVRVLHAVPHEEIPRIISTADVCVCPWAPSVDTNPLCGIPLKLLEYLSCRRPVVVPDSPIVREIFGPEHDDNPCALLFTPNDAGALAQALMTLLVDPAAGRNLAERGYAWVRTRFSASASRRRVLSAYQRVLPAGTALWGHRHLIAGAVPGTGETAVDGTGGWPYTPAPATTPGRERRASGGGTEPWIVVNPDTGSHSRIAMEDLEPVGELEFVAAGDLLGGHDDDTNPQGRKPTDG